MKKFVIASLFVLVSAFSAQAAQKCYKEVTTPEKLVCNSTDSNNADFAEGCKIDGGGTDQEEVPCAAQWVNISSKNAVESQAQVCARKGLNPTTIGGQRCAAGERRPVTGDNYQNINYRYGKWGSTKNGGANAKLYSRTYTTGSHESPGQTITISAYVCYDSDDKKDMDVTDYVVAYACE